jgi:hypothetical protein
MSGCLVAQRNKQQVTSAPLDVGCTCIGTINIVAKSKEIEILRTITIPTLSDYFT